MNVVDQATVLAVLVLGINVGVLALNLKLYTEIFKARDQRRDLS